MDTQALKSSAERLKALLNREASLYGRELELAVDEKEKLVAELETAFAESQGSNDENAVALREALASLAFSNRHALESGRIRLQLSRLGQPKARAVSTPRVDLIS